MYTIPLAVSDPAILLGSRPVTRLSTRALLPGCTNRTPVPRGMLKLLKLMIAPLLAVITVFEPFCWIDAFPRTTCPPCGCADAEAAIPATAAKTSGFTRRDPERPPTRGRGNFMSRSPWARKSLQARCLPYVNPRPPAPVRTPDGGGFPLRRG